MPTIAKHNDVITVIIIFAVEPERQQELIDHLCVFATLRDIIIQTLCNITI